MKPLIVRILQLLGGSAAYSGAQWVMISLVAHTGGAVPVGQFSLAMSIATPLAILFSLSSRMLLQMEVGAKRVAFKHYWHLRLITNVLFCFAILIVGIVREDGAYVFWLLIAVALFRVVETLSDVVNGLAQQHDRQDLLSASLFLRGAAALLAFAVGYALTRNLIVASCLICVAWALVFYFHDWRLTRQWHGSLRGWDFATLARMAWIALPVGVSVFVSGFNIVIPRLFLESYAGVGALGVFSALAYTLTLGNLLVSSISNTLLTSLARHWDASNLEAFRSLIVKSTALLGVVCVIGIAAAALFGREILLVLYGPEFADYEQVFLVVAIGASLLMIGTMWNYMMIGTREFWIQLVLNIVLLVVVTAASFWLIPRGGIMGAAYTIVVLGFARCVLSFGNFFYSMRKKSLTLAVSAA